MIYILHGRGSNPNRGWESRASFFLKKKIKFFGVERLAFASFSKRRQRFYK